MQITDIRIKLSDDPDDRLKAFCSITFDGEFVVRDMKIIEGHKGPFVAMPSRKLCDKCQKCRHKNELRARYCSNCGSRQPERPQDDNSGRNRLFADIAHPINVECRERIQAAVLETFADECERARQPGYKSRYDDYDVDLPAAAAPTVSTTPQVDVRCEPAHAEAANPPHRVSSDRVSSDRVASDRTAELKSRQ